MNPRTASAAARAALVAVGATLVACAAQTPEERVAELRADFEVSLNSVQVVEQPLATATPVDPVAVGEPATEEAAAGAVAATGIAGEEESPAVPVRQEVVLDLVVRNLGDGRLPWLTVDVEQADAAGRPKASHRIYLDTSTIGPGSERAIAHRLEGVHHAPGDGFNVELRQAIPPEQRSAYPEFGEAAEGPGEPGTP